MAAGVGSSPRPAVTVLQAAEIAARHFGLRGPVVEFGSNQDRNFRVDSPDSGPFVLKIANRCWSRAGLEAQSAALAHCAAAGVAVPAPVPSLAGELLVDVDVGGGQPPLPARALTFLAGRPLSEACYLAPSVVAALGTLAGQTSAALATFAHDGLDAGPVQWNLARGADVMRALAPNIARSADRAVVEALAAAAGARLAAVAPSLRWQAVHGDITDDNVVCCRDGAGRLVPRAVIDFGDLARSWAVAELAVALTGVLRHMAAPLTVLPAVAAFHAAAPLDAADAEALWPLVCLRACVLVSSAETQAAVDPGNAYAAEGLPSEWHILRTAAGLPFDVAEAAVRGAVGLVPACPPRLQAAAAAAAAACAPLLPASAAARVEVVVADLSAATGESERFNAGGFLRGAAVEEEVLRDVAAAAASVAASVAASTGSGGDDPPPLANCSVVVSTRHGEARITRCPCGLDSAAPPATVALGVDLLVPAGTPVAAPWAGSVSGIAPDATLPLTRCTTVALDVNVPSSAAEGSGGGSLRLTVAGLDLDDSPAAPRVAVAAGAHIGRVGPAGRLRVALCVSPEAATLAGGPPPFVAAGAEAAAWAAVCPCPPPALLGGADVSAPAATSGALTEAAAAGMAAARAAHAASPQAMYYEAAPPVMARGWRAHLVDTGGRAYVDCVNNVTAIGHGHPGLATAVSAALRRLNTNSRFLYPGLPALCARLAALAPSPRLDAVFLVNSGSEAVELAVRAAQAATGRRHVVAVREAYHGWTAATDALTTESVPLAAPDDDCGRPEWVRCAPAPNALRGMHRGPGAAAAYGAGLRDLFGRMAAAGAPPAAFICEPVLGNAGGVLLPPGYLRRAFDDVRAAGGLAIADEVQCGYGRTGSHFWGCSREGAEPDIVAVAKAAGNGFPLGAVLMPRAVADALRAAAPGGSVFSSAGGSPASCAAGLAVLDAVEQEGLQANAAEVGALLHARLSAVAAGTVAAAAAWRAAGCPGGGHRVVCAAVHGVGLYLGLELTRARSGAPWDGCEAEAAVAAAVPGGGDDDISSDLEPATAEAAAVCARLRELGVVCQPAGARSNVLKMKPPLCLGAAAASFAADQIEAVLLRDGW